MHTLDNRSTTTSSGTLPASIYQEYKRKPFEQPEGKERGYTTATVRFFGGTIDGKPPTVDFKTGEHNISRPHEEIVKVNDLRTLDPPATLKFEGCEFVHSPASLTEDVLEQPDKEAADKWVKENYWPECAALVKERIGAVKAVPYHWRHRRMTKDTNISDGHGTTSKPVQNFHVDNDRSTAVTHLKKHLGEEEAAKWMKKHWGIVNVWRPVGDTVKQWPLALLDSHTIDRQKLTQSVMTLNNYKPASTILVYNPDFRFYYASDLTPEEALIFVDYDDRPADLMVGVAHGAFEDHSSPKDAPLRRSTEVRVLVLLEELDE